jgi:hypothetical protein
VLCIQVTPARFHQYENNQGNCRYREIPLATALLALDAELPRGG